MNPQDVVGHIERLLGQIAAEKLEVRQVVAELRGLAQQNREEAVALTNTGDLEAMGFALGAAAGFDELADKLEEMDPKLARFAAEEALLAELEKWEGTK